MVQLVEYSEENTDMFARKYGDGVTDNKGSLSKVYINGEHY